MNLSHFALMYGVPGEVPGVTILPKGEYTITSKNGVPFIEEFIPADDPNLPTIRKSPESVN